MKNEKTVSAIENKHLELRSVLIAFGITVLMCLGFTVMLATAFKIQHSFGNILVYSVVISGLFIFFYYLKNKWLTMSALIAAPVIFAILLLTDIFGVGEGLAQFLENFMIYSTLWFLENNTGVAERSSSAIPFFLAYDLIPVSLTAYALMRRKFIPLSLIPYLPFFICSVINTAKYPDQIPVIIASVGFTGALIVHFTRRKKREMAEKMLVILAAPVILFGTVMGLVYPENSYNKNELANDILAFARETYDRSAQDEDSIIHKMIEIADKGWRGTAFGSGGGQFTSLYATTTYLNDVGPFDPSSTEVLKTYKYKNRYYSGNPEERWDIITDGDIYSSYAGNTLYLKVESLDTYENNKLTAENIRMNPYPSSLSFPDIKDGENMAEYVLSVTPLEPCLVDIVPYYSDWYISEADTDITHVNPYNTTSGGSSTFSMSPRPIRTGDIYSEKYLETYVYNTALKVPEATERALITSGKLPQWYLDVYYGNSEMSDADKVRKVTEFVSKLHPYDKDTKYPPKNKDFVPWFVSEAESGICVHYAATSMILLRMIGVPARYVRGYIDTGSYPNQESIIYASQAHAWFEFFLPDYGWVMGDATPGYTVDASSHNIDAVAHVDSSVENKTFAHEREPVVSKSEIGYRAPSERTGETDPAPKYTVPASVSVTPTPSSTPTPVPTKVPAPKEKSRLEIAEENFIFWAKVVLTIASVTALLCLITKLVFFIYWTRSFKTDNINKRAIAYYKLYRFTCRFTGGRPLSEVTKIAEKAAFSDELLTQEEYDELLSLCSRYTFEILNNLSGPKWLLYKITTVKIGT